MCIALPDCPSISLRLAELQQLCSSFPHPQEIARALGTMECVCSWTREAGFCLSFLGLASWNITRILAETLRGSHAGDGKHIASPAAQVLVALVPLVPALPNPETPWKNVLLHGMKIVAGHRSSFPNHSPRAGRTSDVLCELAGILLINLGM